MGYPGSCGRAVRGPPWLGRTAEYVSDPDDAHNITLYRDSVEFVDRVERLVRALREECRKRPMGARDPALTSVSLRNFAIRLRCGDPELVVS